MTDRNYPDWLKAYLEYSSSSEAPDKFHFWTGVSVIAGALRRCVWIDQGYFEWTPNFYIIFVAPPGIVSKSTTASIGMRLLRQVPGINFGPDAVTWQALAQAFAHSTEQVEIDGVFHPMSALTIVSSEFGTFLNPSDREMVDMLVSLWDGQRGAWTKTTKTQGNDTIENPWVNILACTTPGWIAGNFPEYMIGGGFTSRCVFVYGEQKRRLVPYPANALPPDFAEMERKLVQDLERIAQIRGPYTLTEEALAWGVAWYEHNYKTNIEKGGDERFQGYYARKQSHLHKLAIILKAAKSDERVIDVEELELADQLLAATETDMPKVFSQIGRTEETRSVEHLISLVFRQGKVDAQKIYAEYFSRFLTYPKFTEVVVSAVNTGYVKQVQINERIYLVRSEHAAEVLNGAASGI